DWLGELSTFCLYTSFNEGALWGVGQGYAWLFAALSVVAVFVILFVLLKTPAGRSNWLTFALCLVLGGTLGNLYDRLGWHGYINAKTGKPYLAVRDFLLFTFKSSTSSWSWPVFNYADVFLVTGTGMLVAYSFWSERQAAKQVLLQTGNAQPA
ncbi:MAG: signal peptidase II, partial [Planctomycetia bacterium]|nr:signal peptidase II [Planctomycetia bacterium]